MRRPACDRVSLEWAFVVLGGPVMITLTLGFHLTSAPLSPVLAYFLVVLLFLSPLPAGVGLAVALVPSVSLYLGAHHDAPDVMVRLGLDAAFCALTWYVKTRLARNNRQRQALIAERGSRRLEAVLDAAPEPMVMVDERGHITRVNVLMERLSGYARAELVGQTVDVLVPQDQKERHAAERALYMAAPGARTMGHGRELDLLHRDGTLIPVEIALTPVHEDDATRVVASVVDITIRKTLQEMHMRAVLAAEDANARAEAAERRAGERSAFMSAAAHELRTPLTVVRGYAEIAQDILQKTGELLSEGRGATDPAYVQQRSRFERMLPAMMRQTEKMEKLVMLLLDVGRLERGHLSLVLQQTDLAALVREAAQNAQVADGDHALNLNDVPETLAAWCDPLRIDQVISNLLHNAQQYSPPGSTIRVRLRQNGTDAVLAVDDEGLGIPEEEKAKVWERFYQVGRTERSQGLGLGLYLVKMFVEMHNGTAELTDGPSGTGTTVIVKLPLERSQPSNDEGSGMM